MPPKPKGGVPLAEKKRRLLDIFAQLDADGRPTMYSIKELESAGSKRGVASMQIKDLINDLVGDKLVDMEKIGGGNFYWALPSKTGQRLRQRLGDLSSAVNKEQSKLISVRDKNDTMKAERTPGKEREKKLAALEKLKAEEATLRKGLQRYHDSDPTVLKKMRKDAEEIFAGCNRWGDNLFQTRQYVEANMNVRPDQFEEEYGACERDFESVDWTTWGIEGV